MICPKCNQRMKCIDSFNEPEKMQTARYYKCDCGETLYTMEEESSVLNVRSLLTERQLKANRVKHEQTI